MMMICSCVGLVAVVTAYSLGYRHGCYDAHFDLKIGALSPPEATR